LAWKSDIAYDPDTSYSEKPFELLSKPKTDMRTLISFVEKSPLHLIHPTREQLEIFQLFKSAKESV
jgi:hypothetical protein